MFGFKNIKDGDTGFTDIKGKPIRVGDLVRDLTDDYTAQVIKDSYSNSMSSGYSMGTRGMNNYASSGLGYKVILQREQLPDDFDGGFDV